MKKLSNGFLGALALLAALATGARASAQQLRGMTEVDCDGLACGGSGGNLGCDYVYRIHPNGNAITSFDVSVEDGDLDRYVYRGPADWSMCIVNVARSHDYAPTVHGRLTAPAGKCSYVLRFHGPARTRSFQVGFDYAIAADGVFHDAHWKTSDDRQASWSFPAGAGKGPVHSPVRLNVLLIVLDDVGTDKLELFDTPHADLHGYAPIPTLETLAADGIQFTSFYVNPVCSTSRACFQTGRYSYRHGVGEVIEQHVLDDCEVTLGELLKLGFPSPDDAYSTGAFGKWHLTPNNTTNTNFTEHALRNGYDRFFGTLNTSGHFSFVQVQSDVDFGVTTTEHIQNRWSADVVRQDASTWMDTASEPFFAYVAFSPPHFPFRAPPLETEDHRPLISQPTIDEIASGDEEALYRAMLEAVDSEIGYLLADMDPARRARTMVIVASDNGTPEDMVSQPHDSTRAKGTVYDLGVRVPMIISGPLATRGVCDAAVGGVDLFATIAAMTGADANLVAADACADPARDSLSFLRLIRDPSGPTKRFAFSQIFTPNGVVDDETSFDDLSRNERAVTDGRYKYIRRLRQVIPPSCFDCADLCCYEEEFYDLIADPHEEMNLGSYPGGLEKLYGSMWDYMNLSEL